MADCRTTPIAMTGAAGCSQDPLRSLALAIAYVPWQCWDQTYDLEKALMIGTIFPELNKPFLGKRGGCR